MDIYLSTYMYIRSIQIKNSYISKWLVPNYLWLPYTIAFPTTTNNIEDCIEQGTKEEISRERRKIRNPILREIVQQCINFIFKSTRCFQKQ